MLGKMAERPDVPPSSMEGIFEILAQIPKDQLVRYEHKLSHMRGDRRLCGLLRTMVLLTLNQEAEARGSLDALGYDPVAAHIYRSHRGHTMAGAESDDEVALAVAQAVAQIYALLAEEKLCHPDARDQAYRAAAHVFRQCQVDPTRLKSLVDEARERCGQVFAATLSGNEALPAGSRPVPIPLLPDPLSLDPHSLRSTGTPLSFVSHFAISPATTMAWEPASDREPDAETCGSSPDDLAKRSSLEPPDPPSSPAREGTPCHASAGRGAPPSMPRPNPDRRTGEQGTPPPQPGPTPQPGPKPPNAAKELPAAEGGLPQKPDALSGPRSLSLDPPKPTEGPSPLKPKKEVQQQDVPGPAFPTASSLGDEPQFFSFVVLHAGEDEEMACRVKSQLEHLGVPDGATYSEDFLVPGRVHIDCFQEALDNSAFTLLLLTENFRNRFCTYQTSVALMDSFQRFCKSNSVVPFIPKEKPIPAREMPTVLAGLVPLEESSPVFRKRVQNTFTAQTLREKKAAWQIRARQRQQERDRAYQEMLKCLKGLYIPGNQPPAGHFPPPPYATPLLPPAGAGPFAPGPDHPSLSHSFLLSAGALQPQFIIQNAQMIQIGDYNQMQAEQAQPVLGEDAGEE